VVLKCMNFTQMYSRREAKVLVFPTFVDPDSRRWVSPENNCGKYSCECGTLLVIPSGDPCSTHVLSRVTSVQSQCHFWRLLETDMRTSLKWGLSKGSVADQFSTRGVQFLPKLNVCNCELPPSAGIKRVSPEPIVKSSSPQGRRDRGHLCGRRILIDVIQFS